MHWKVFSIAMNSQPNFLVLRLQSPVNSKSRFLKEEIVYSIILFSLNAGFLARDFIHAQPKDACKDTRQTSETRQLSSGIGYLGVLVLE